jgi:hypothetical protein
MTAERVTAAYVTRRNGAYLIEPTGPLMHVPGPDMTSADVASSLVLAKRVAVKMTTSMGYVGGALWEQSASNQWKLHRGYDEDSTHE